MKSLANDFWKKLQSFRKQIFLFLSKNHSYSFIDIARFIFNFLSAFLVFFISLSATKLIGLKTGESLSGDQWVLIGVFSFLLVIFTYVKELFAGKRKQRKIEGFKVITDSIGGAIEQLTEMKSKNIKEKQHIVYELLKYIEKVVKIILEIEGYETGEFCANLMIKNDQGKLEILYFGTFLSGREKLQLQIDTSNPMPGAPEAYVFRKTMYIDDTTSIKFSKYFDKDKSYRSIISIPVLNIDKEVIAIINIDSTKINQFISGDFVSKRIVPIITPFIDLLKLEKENIINNNSTIRS